MPEATLAARVEYLRREWHLGPSSLEGGELGTLLVAFEDQAFLGSQSSVPALYLALS